MSFTVERPLSSCGIQSDIFLGYWNGKQAVRKVSRTKLNEEDMNTILEVTPKYREEMAQAEIRVPENFSTRVINGGRLEAIDEFIEGREVNGDDLDVWGRMVGTIIKAEDKFIDAKPPNFIEGRRGMFYVDTYPPMIRENGLVGPWIEPLFKRNREMMTFNFGDPRGRLTKLLSLVKIQQPEDYEVLGKKTLEVAKDNLPSEDYDYVKDQHDREFPDMQAMYQEPGFAGIIAGRLLKND